MFYRIKVYDDGDVYVTKRKKRALYDGELHFDILDRVRAELTDYGVPQVDEALEEIRRAPVDEAVRC